MSDTGRVGWSPGYGAHRGDSPFAGVGVVTPAPLRVDVEARIAEAAARAGAVKQKDIQERISDLLDWINTSQMDDVDLVDEIMRRLEALLP